MQKANKGQPEAAIRRVAVVLTRKKGIVLALAIALTPGLAQAWLPGHSYNFTLLHTNDEHGHFWPNEQNEYGLAAQKTLMDQQRYDAQAKGGGALILSAGDVNTGVPESDITHAEPDIRGMNLIGYDAMALGNHEFDKSLSVLQQQQKWARFPFIAANVYQKQDGKRLFKPWAVFNRMGLKIAVIGLSTPDTLKLASPLNVQNLEFRDPVSETLKALAELRQQEKPDVVIVLSHLGWHSEGINDVTLAQALPQGSVGAIVGGHSHDLICMDKQNQPVKEYKPGDPCLPDVENGIWIMQAGEWGKYVGRADFRFQDGKLSLANYQLLPVNLRHQIKNEDGSTLWLPWKQEIVPNSAMMKLLLPFKKRAEEKMQVAVGSSNEAFNGDSDVVRYRRSDLAQLILAAQTASTQADLAVMSGGGVRSSLPAGKLTLRDLLQVQPFANQVVSVTLTGTELAQYLTAVAKIPAGSGGYAQFSGVGFVRAGDVLTEITVKGQPLQADKVYRLATNSFNASGGDGYPRIDQQPGYSSKGVTDISVLRDWVQHHSPLKRADYAPDGEIRQLTPEELEQQEKARQQSEKKKALTFPQAILAWFEPLREKHE
ncbi:bifunctional UDP-sugar hydrolase/5'-nucleotidase UshA [Pantoea sp. A4]|uniref:bifunctional UDP-sugar hydrolase/5'-nucleotidase UshA n=1 Tax=Pantoea sp. A4 TaxID=1225184 RepID=UPI001ED98AD7|nr:bifunctional UDP-sugar hydrolase/5'-nucleotidase UshA [Pantoea sp. A4]